MHEGQLLAVRQGAEPRVIPAEARRRYAALGFSFFEVPPGLPSVSEETLLSELEARARASASPCLHEDPIPASPAKTESPQGPVKSPATAEGAPPENLPPSGGALPPRLTDQSREEITRSERPPKRRRS